MEERKLHGFTPEEFDELSAGWEPSIKLLAAARRTEQADRARPLVNFGESTAATLRAVLGRLIPQSAGVDLAAFIDAAADRPLGRGDRPPGLPDGSALFVLGLAGVDEAARELFGARFAGLPAEQQDAVLDALVNGTAPGAIWQRIPSLYFFQRLYAKALHGYLSHPEIWRRIGFMGPSYPEGYVWLGRAQVQQRHARQPGWEKF